MKYRLYAFILMVVLVCFSVEGCYSPPPHNQDNICRIFYQYPQWFWAAQRTERKWGIPISVQMAIIREESSFQPDVKPPRVRLLGFIPWLHETTAEGYAQALNDTWLGYLRATGHRRISRSSFNAAIDFVGWFCHEAHARLGIPRDNAYELYLAYHEGIIGYSEHTYLRKPWLISVAHHVQSVADNYRGQLLVCAPHLPQHPWWDFFRG